MFPPYDSVCALRYCLTVLCIYIGLAALTKICFGSVQNVIVSTQGSMLEIDATAAAGLQT